MRVSELSGKYLDYYVAKALGHTDAIIYGRWAFTESDRGQPPYKPSTDWAQGGELIEEHRISLNTLWLGAGGYVADIKREANIISVKATGSTPLEAAMRALVFSVFGEEVEE